MQRPAVTGLGVLVRPDGLREWNGQDCFTRSIDNLDHRISPQFCELVHDFPCDFQSFCKGSIHVWQLCAVRIRLKLVAASDVEEVQGHHGKKPALGEKYRLLTISA